MSLMRHLIASVTSPYVIHKHPLHDDFSELPTEVKALGIWHECTILPKKGDLFQCDNCCVELAYLMW